MLGWPAIDMRKERAASPVRGADRLAHHIYGRPVHGVSQERDASHRFVFRRTQSLYLGTFRAGMP